jgi:hypothetical protein
LPSDWSSDVALPILVIFFLAIRGYSVFGVREESFRRALLGAFSSLGLTPEETLCCLRVRETGQEVKVMVQGVLGTAQLRPRGRESRVLVGEVAAGLRLGLRGEPANLLVAWLHLFLGGVLAVTALSLVLLAGRP